MDRYTDPDGLTVEAAQVHLEKTNGELSEWVTGVMTCTRDDARVYRVASVSWVDMVNGVALKAVPGEWIVRMPDEGWRVVPADRFTSDYTTQFN